MNYTLPRIFIGLAFLLFPFLKFFPVLQKFFPFIDRPIFYIGWGVFGVLAITTALLIFRPFLKKNFDSFTDCFFDLMATNVKVLSKIKFNQAGGWIRHFVYFALLIASVFLSLTYVPQLAEISIFTALLNFNLVFFWGLAYLMRIVV